MPGSTCASTTTCTGSSLCRNGACVCSSGFQLQQKDFSTQCLPSNGFGKFGFGTRKIWGMFMMHDLSLNEYCTGKLQFKKCLSIVTDLPLLNVCFLGPIFKFTFYKLAT